MIGRTLVVIPALLFLTASVSADASTTYTIRKGDTLQKIARTFRVPLSEIRTANMVDDRKLRPGQKIVIPSPGAVGKDAGRLLRHKSTGEAAQEIHVTQEIDAAVFPDSEHDRIDQYVVRKGDTLLKIARIHGLSVRELKEMNNLNTARIKAGQTLTVNQSPPAVYTVRKGENLWVIARRFRLDPDEIIEINDLDSTQLKPGQQLHLTEPQESEESLVQDASSHGDTGSDSMEQPQQETDIAQDTLQDRVITFAKRFIDIPYRFGGSTFLGIDCSAFVKKVYALIGFDLPRTAREQFKEGLDIERKDLSTGDLVFFRTYASFPSHVGIYIGDNLFIHASSRGKRVKIDSLDKTYYLKRFIGGKRLLSQDTGSDEHRPVPQS